MGQLLSYNVVDEMDLCKPWGNISADVWRHIFSYKSYQELVELGVCNIFDLSAALDQEYGTRSFVSFLKKTNQDGPYILLAEGVYSKIGVKVSQNARIN